MIKYSIIIPTVNRPKLLKQNLKNLLLVDYPSDCYELIVVVNSKSDMRTIRLLEKIQKDFSQLRFFIQEKPGPSHARNTGILAAKYDHQIFIDDDVLVEKTILSDFSYEWEKNPKTTLIGGKIIALPIERKLNRQETKTVLVHSWIYGAQDKGHVRKKLQKSEILLAGLLGIYQDSQKKALFNTNLGKECGFPVIIGAEDVEFTKRLLFLQKSVIYSPSIQGTNLFNITRLSHQYISTRYFFNGIERYIADKILLSDFSSSYETFATEFFSALKGLFFFKTTLFSKYLRNKYDIIMLLSYFFCGPFFFNQAGNNEQLKSNI